MITGVYKTNGLSNLYFSQFQNFALEPGGIGLIDKLWVESVTHDLYYNYNGVNLNLVAAATNYWTKLGGVVYPVTPGDNVSSGTGFLRTDMGLRDQYVLIPVPIGETFTSFDNLGAELITDGDFPNNINWTEGSAWSIGAGKASIINGDANDLSQAAPPLVLTEGTWYAISFDIVDVAVGGTVTPKLTGAIPVVGTPQSTTLSGTYTQYLLSTTDSLTGLAFTSDALASGASIDNVSIKAVVSFLSSLFSSTSIIGCLNELAATSLGGSFSDAVFQIYDSADNTKIIMFDAGLVSPATTRTVAVPDRSFTMDNISETITTTNIGANKVVQSDGTNIISTDLEFNNATKVLSGPQEIDISGATSGTTGFKAPAVAGSTIYELPGSDGTSGQVLKTDGAAVLHWEDPIGITSYARFLDVLSVTTDGGGTTTVICNVAHGLTGGERVVMAGWDVPAVNGLWTIVFSDAVTFTFASGAGAGASTGGTARYVIGIDTTLTNVILAKYKCNDIVIENPSGTAVTLDIGTTLAGNEIALGLVCAAGSIQQVSVNQIFSSTVAQSIYLTATGAGWTTAYVDAHITQNKIMN